MDARNLPIRTINRNHTLLQDCNNNNCLEFILLDLLSNNFYIGDDHSSAILECIVFCLDTTQFFCRDNKEDDSSKDPIFVAILRIIYDMISPPPKVSLFSLSLEDLVRNQ